MRTVEDLLSKTNLELHVIDLELGKMSYFEVGTRKNPSLVFLHGFGTNALDFFQIAQRLENNFHIILIDLPFSGESNLYYTDSYKPVEISEWLKEGLEIIGVSQFHLIGHSISAHYIFDYASRNKVLSLIALDGGYLKPNMFEGYSLEEELKVTAEIIRQSKYKSEQHFFDSHQSWTENEFVIARRNYKSSDEGLIFSLPENIAVQMIKDTADCPDYDVIQQIMFPILILRSSLPAEINHIREHCVEVFKEYKEVEVVTLEQSEHDIHHSNVDDVVVKLNDWVNNLK